MPLKPVSLRGEVSSIDIADNASGCTFYAYVSSPRECLWKSSLTDVLHRGLYCDGESFDMGAPGTSDLAGSGWNDRIQSGKCY